MPTCFQVADVHAVGAHLHGKNVQRSANIKGLKTLCSCLLSFPWWPIQLGSAGNSPAEKWEGHGPPEMAPRLKNTQHIRNVARIFFPWNLCALTKYWTNMFFKIQKLRRWQVLKDSVWWASDGYFDTGYFPHSRNKVEDTSSSLASILVPGGSSSSQENWGEARSLAFCLRWLMLL